MSPHDPLVKLFGGPARVKLLRLFLLNPELTLDRAEISKRSKVPARAVAKEIQVLTQIGLIKSAQVILEGARGKKIKVNGSRLNTGFKLNAALSELLFDTDLFSNEELIKRFQGIGKVKLIITAGVFLREIDSRVDLLLVVDAMKKSALDRIIKQLESEIGRELNYTVFSSADFTYRVSMYDKFVRDVLDYSHNTVIDKIGLEPSPYNLK